MNISFNSEHMQTIKELLEIADKHNCRFTFGFNSDSCAEVSEKILQHNDMSIEMIDTLYSSFYLSNEHSDYDSVWFELYDMNNKTHNSLVYQDMYTCFYYDDCAIDDDSTELEQQVMSWLDDNNDYDEKFVSKSLGLTVIRGFNSPNDYEENYLVYRSGMALKFFADKVCEYLGESITERTY